MPYLRQTGEMIFTSTTEVITYYTMLIDELTPHLQGVDETKYQAIKTEIAGLRKELAEHLKSFGHTHVDEYFNEAMATAESDQEFHKLSNAYETLLQSHLTLIKKKLHTLRTV